MCRLRWLTFFGPPCKRVLSAVPFTVDITLRFASYSGQYKNLKETLESIIITLYASSTACFVDYEVYALRKFCTLLITLLIFTVTFKIAVNLLKFLTYCID